MSAIPINKVCSLKSFQLKKSTKHQHLLRQVDLNNLTKRSSRKSLGSSKRMTSSHREKSSRSIRVPSHIESHNNLLLRHRKPSQNAPDFPISGQEALGYIQKKLTKEEKKELEEQRWVYYLGKNSINYDIFGNKKASYADKKGFYRAFIGDHILYRYQITGILGQGTFGKVCKCYDHKKGEEVAVKIIRKRKIYLKQGLKEIEILKSLSSESEKPNSHVVKMKKYFLFRKHIVMVFELLKESLFKVIIKNRVLQMPYIRKIACDILLGLKTLKDKNIVHCDLKPENILFTQNRTVKLIDFGISCFMDQQAIPYIQSRPYRAPEVLMGEKYDRSVDMWSFGCILIEMHIGKPFFHCESSQELVTKICRSLNSPMNMNFTDNDSDSLDYWLRGANEEFVDLVKKCLKWNPNERISVEDALDHNFIKKRKLNSCL